MNQQNGRTGVLLATVAALILMVLGFLLLIKPQLDAAAVADEDRAITAQDNEILEIRLASLKQLATEVDGWQENLDAIAAQMPRLPEIDSLEVLLVSTGDQAGVAHVESRVEAISAIDGAALASSGDSTATAAVEETAGVEDSGLEDGAPATEDTETPATTDETVTETGPVVDGLVAIQFTIVVEGKASAVMRFINLLHSQEDRFITISGMTVTRSEGAEESPGRPELELGDWNASVSALAFAVVDPTLPVEVDESEAVEPFTGTFKNPFNTIAP